MKNPYQKRLEEMVGQMITLSRDGASELKGKAHLPGHTYFVIAIDESKSK